CGTGACSASVAQAELTAMLRRNIPVNDQPKSAYQLVSMVDQAAERVRLPLFILLGAVAFVLAIAAANVTSLLIGRVHARERELAECPALDQPLEHLSGLRCHILWAAQARDVRSEERRVGKGWRSW